MSEEDAASKKDATSGDTASVDKTEQTAAETETAAAETDAAEDTKTVALGKSEESGETEQAQAEQTVELSKSEATAKSGAKSEAPAKSERPAAGGRGSRQLIVLVAAGVVLAAALGAVVLFYLQANNRQEELDTRAAATKAACDFGYAFTNFSAEKIDDYLKRVSDSSTGEWKTWVDQSGQALKTAVVEKQISSVANEVQCGFQSGDERAAKVVLVIDQTFRNPSSQGAGDRGTLAAVVDMENSDGRWLVAKFDTPAVTPLGN